MTDRWDEEARRLLAQVDAPDFESARDISIIAAALRGAYAEGAREALREAAARILDTTSRDCAALRGLVEQWASAAAMLRAEVDNGIAIRQSADSKLGRAAAFELAAEQLGGLVPKVPSAAPAEPAPGATLICPTCGGAA